MQPTTLQKFMQQYGTIESYDVNHVFHTQDFPNKLFLLTKGYVKRYQATQSEHKILELIYGPGQTISLSTMYKRLFGVDQNQEGYIYVYQAMTDIEMYSVSGDLIVEELKQSADLHQDFFYQSGLVLRSNIARLASNAIKDDYKKVAHQLMSSAYEFSGLTAGSTDKTVELPLPQSAIDMAEQLNISKEVCEAVLSSLEQSKLIARDGSKITILNTDLLKDAYL